MKILFVTRGCPDANDPLNGIFEFDQAKAMAAAGHEAHYIAMDFSRKGKGKWFLSNYKKEGVDVWRWFLPTGVYRRALPFLRAMLDHVYRKVAVRYGKPDIVHTQFYFMGALCTDLKKKYGLTIIHTEHSSKLNKPLNEISKLDQKLARAAYQNADVITSVSKALAKKLKENFGVHSMVIPNMVDDTAFNTPSDFRSPDEDFVFVSTGRLAKGKNFDLLLHIFDAIDLEDHCSLHIFGDGPQRPQLEEIIKTFPEKVQSKITLHGAASRGTIAQFYQRSHAFVLLSDKETFGVSYIEAMYSGLPVIATKCGGPEDFVNKKNGILVDHTLKSAAEAMIKMYEEYYVYNRYQIANECKARFAPDVIAKEIEEAYKFCIKLSTHDSKPTRDKLSS